MHGPTNIKIINMFYVCGNVLPSDKNISIFGVSATGKKYIIVELE